MSVEVRAYQAAVVGPHIGAGRLQRDGSFVIVVTTSGRADVWVVVVSGKELFKGNFKYNPHVQPGDSLSGRVDDLVLRAVAPHIGDDLPPVQVPDPRYPSACPFCGSPAYVGAREVDCSAACGALRP